MWLWDSCYHSLGANHLDPNLAWDYLQAVLAAAGPDGAIAIERTPATAGGAVNQTQPPLLTWAVAENWRAAVAAGVANATLRERLEYAVPRLAAYLRWDLTHRSDLSGRTPLLRWTQGTESGMDNSPRFDNGTSQLLAVDFSVFLAREAALLAQLAAEVGNATEAGFWSRLAAKVSTSIHEVMWNEAQGLYFDATCSRTGCQLSDMVASTALLPLWLEDIPRERIPRLIDALHDPRRFGTRTPLPSTGRAMAQFGTDMWRGPVVRSGVEPMMA